MSGHDIQEKQNVDLCRSYIVALGVLRNLNLLNNQRRFYMLLAGVKLSMRQVKNKVDKFRK